MPVSGVSTKRIQAIENDIAVQLDSGDALVSLELLLRALHRRGYIDADDMKMVEQDLARAHKGNRRALNAFREARQRPNE